MIDSPDLTLYYAPDNASLCVRLALEECGLPYRASLVDRGRKAQRDPAYLAINPNGLIPTMRTPTGPIYETGAILLWLADTRPGQIFPAPDAPGRGPALSRLFWLANTLHPTLRMLFYPDQYCDTDPDALRCVTRQRIVALLTLLEDDPDSWDPADSPSVIACYLAPLLRWPALYGGATAWYDLARWPRLLDFARRFEQRPAAHAAAQAEGLGPTPFSAPSFPQPPEGSPL